MSSQSPNGQPQPPAVAGQYLPTKMRDDVKALMALLSRQHKDITVLVEEICVLSQVVQEANAILHIGGHTQEFLQDVVALRASLQRARRTLVTAQRLAADVVVEVEEMVVQMERVQRYACVKKEECMYSSYHV